MIKHVEHMLHEIRQELKGFTDIAVLGMSGGADSTLVAILCVTALGRENVYGYGMPFDDVDETTFNSRSHIVAEKLGINYQEISIHDPVISAGARVMTATKRDVSPLNFGNIKSRMRMVMLYSLNASIAEETGKKCRVIGTGNLSEDYIGYDTKGGDALADIFPIGGLFKSEVYQLLDYFRDHGIIEDDMIDRVPSAGLESGQTDEGDLGYTYDEMEKAIRMLLASKGKPVPRDGITQFVAYRHYANKHKHEASNVIDVSEFNGTL